MPQALINILEPVASFIEDNFEILLEFYVLGPFYYLVFYKFIYCKCIKKRKKKKVSFKAKMKKFFSIPCMLIMAVPGFVIEMMEQEFWDNTYEEQWETAMCILGLLVIIYTIIQYGLIGIWIGPVRAAVGIMIGMSIAVLIIVILGLFLVMVVGDGDENHSVTIDCYGEKVTLIPTGDVSYDSIGQKIYHYYDGYTREQAYPGYVFDEYGRSFPIIG